MRILSTLLLASGLLFTSGTPAVAQQLAPADQLIELFEKQEGYYEARLNSLADPQLGDAVLEELSSHPDWRVRTQAAILEGWRQSPQLYVEVYDASSIPGRRGRRHRFLAEAFQQPSAAPAILERILHGGEPGGIRAGLAHSLVGLHPHWGEDMIGLLGAAEDSTVAVAAVAAFQWADADVALPGLRMGLEHREGEVRAAAASVAAWRPDGIELAPALRRSLADSHGETRAMSARALGWLGDAQAVDSLALLLDDPEGEVRLHALRSLGRIAPERARADQRIERLVGDSDPRVARVARRISGPTR